MSSQPGKPAKLEDPKAVLNRELWAVLTPGIILTLIGFLLAFTFVGAPPPKTLRFASGSSWGAYNRYAQMYKQELAKEGLNVQVLETKGSTENLRLLVEGKADIAFVQGGIVPPSADVELVSLGSVYFEPLWLFIRSDVPQSRFSQLEGKRIAIGPEGSGTRAVALELLEDAEVIDQVMTVDAGGEAAEQMLEEGAAVDAAQTFSAILGEDPAHAGAYGGLVRAHIAMGEIDKAEAILNGAPAEISKTAELEAAHAQIELARQAADAGPVAELEAAVEADPANLQARFDLAQALYASGKTEEAVAELLELFRRDREWNDGAAKQQLFTIFEALAPNDPIALTGRRKLSSMILA